MNVRPVPRTRNRKPLGIFLASLLTTLLLHGIASAQALNPASFPPHAEVLKGFTKVVTKANIKPMYTLYRNAEGKVYAELPTRFATSKYFIAMTTSSGETYAGLQGGDLYVYWRPFGKRLALIKPQLQTRAQGDKAAESSVKRLFTDQILIDVPILTIGPAKGPVIDLNNMLLVNAAKFFGSRGAPNSTQVRNGIFSVAVAKAFENNIEISYEVPTASGLLKKLHYSISDIPQTSSYKPRAADQRIGYFTTTYVDLAKYDDRQTKVRYINRWHLEKADPSLKLSPPKKPIVFYIEHTTPIRYRRWVRKGILDWNKAFEKVGLSQAIEVHYQDAASKAHMDKDPEDVNYNFVRWLNNDIGTAIGPSRVNPLTGQILDADIILTDGWIRYYKKKFNDVLPKVAMEGFSPDTLAWLAKHPKWDPRLRLAAPSQRAVIERRLEAQAALPYSGHPLANTDPSFFGDDEYDGLVGRTSQINGMCLAGESLSFDVAMMRLHSEMLLADAESKEDPAMLDGIPESFVGPLVAHLVAHEVGHTLGLRHNFKASSIHSFKDINSNKLKGKKPLAGSVMDYIGANIYLEGGELQGDFSMQGIGPYDMWAIEYGYTSETDLKPILARVSEPELAFATDEDTFGPDPLARRYDFSKDPLAFAENQVALAKYHRNRLLTNFLKDGDSWDRVRYGYEMTLSTQMRATSMMSNWLGGAFVHRDKKGDPKNRKPIEVVPADQQRKALKFVMEHMFKDDAFGLTPELTVAMGLDKWSDDRSSIFEDATWPIHDTIMGAQASALTQLMNPQTLGRVHDNEYRVPAGQDALTLPELLHNVSDAVWAELKSDAKGKYSARTPCISSLRRNLQREHLERLIDLAIDNKSSDPTVRTISMLSAEELRRIAEQLKSLKNRAKDRLDPYSAAHLTQAKNRIEKALEAEFVISQ